MPCLCLSSLLGFTLFTVQWLIILMVNFLSFILFIYLFIYLFHFHQHLIYICMYIHSYAHKINSHSLISVTCVSISISTHFYLLQKRFFPFFIRIYLFPQKKTLSFLSILIHSKKRTFSSPPAHHSLCGDAYRCHHTHSPFTTHHTSQSVWGRLSVSSHPLTIHHTPHLTVCVGTPIGVFSVSAAARTDKWSSAGE